MGQSPEAAGATAGQAASAVTEAAELPVAESAQIVGDAAATAALEAHGGDAYTTESAALAGQAALAAATAAGMSADQAIEVAAQAAGNAVAEALATAGQPQGQIDVYVAAAVDAARGAAQEMATNQASADYQEQVEMHYGTVDVAVQNLCGPWLSHREACSAYDSCYERVLASWRAQLSHLRTMETGRKAEYQALKLFECYMGVLEAVGEAAKTQIMNECAVMVVDTSHLTLAAPTPPAKEACDPGANPAGCADPAEAVV